MRTPSSNQQPIFVQPGQGGVGIIEDFFPILDDAHDPTLDTALAAYRPAAAHLATIKREATPPTRKAAEDAYRAEEYAAALQARPATITWADVQAAEAAHEEHQARRRAAEAALTDRRTVLVAVIRNAGAAILHPLAVARALVLDAGEDLTSPSARLIDRLYRLILWPDIAYTPARITTRRTFDRWWPLVLVEDRGAFSVHNGMHTDTRADWNAWAWRELARPKRKGYRIGDDGTLAFTGVWTPPAHVSQPRKAFVTSAGRAGQQTGGELVMVGTGPNGEQGATRDQLGWNPVTIG